MRINGSFVIRQVAGEHLAIPVNETALQIGGMIILNPVGRVIMECLQSDTDVDHIVNAITDRFDTTPEEARADVVAFLDQMRAENLIIE